MVFMVILYVFIRDVSSHLNYEHRVFHSEEFLKSRDPDEQLFYRTVCLNFRSDSFIAGCRSLITVYLQLFKDLRFCLVCVAGVGHTHFPLLLEGSPQ